MANSKRQIKINAKYRPTPNGQGEAVAWLNLSGKWLQELGFEIGGQVSITARKKLLVIEPLEDKANAEQQYKMALNNVKQTLKRLYKND